MTVETQLFKLLGTLETYFKINIRYEFGSAKTFAPSTLP